jgi:hypothetical protein
MLFEQETLNLGPFYWFGAQPGEKLPALDKFKTAKHTKGNAQGVKTERPNLRVVPLSEFVKVPDISGVAELLFGKHGHPTAGDA